MNKFGITSLLITTLLLVACHHENPLKTQPAKASAIFLMNASANVEKRLHFAIAQGAYGYGYLECMEGKKSAEIHCPDLLNGIVRFAKENHYPLFKNITLADLTDKATFEQLGDEYAEIAATTWPHYFPVS
ncbi:hypothetical protein [Legionella londiniensis]|uniref:Legionella vir region protein n=1 Tax=Legionella londiniensis TaxID=45068 RepID=A0A0W0VJN3_9GAMM|nr:hypothetical protein [Legionella londiniensis]KTD20125.1 Legionella vir region protein [Legionella londiniensis]STX94292.1 Legionella vir region protein [Legionella londiniensis]